MKLLSNSLLYFLLLPGAALAQQVTLQVDSSTPVPSTLSAGSSFSLSLDLNNQSSDGVAGYDVDVESLAFNTSSNTYVPVSNVLDLTGVTLTNAALNFPNSTDPTAGFPVVLDPLAGSSSQALDLGATNAFTGETVGTGVTPLETLSFQVASSASPGTYELEFFAIDGNAIGPVTIADGNFNSIGTATAPFTSNSFTVTDTPEPPTFLLIGMAGAALLAGFAFRRPRLT